MGIAVFLIVFGFNVLWALLFGDELLETYRGRNNRILGIALWSFTIWGIINLIYAIVK